MAASSSLNPVAVDQPVTFTSTISSVSQVPDGSTIAFYSGTTEIGTETTTAGVAKLTTSFAAAKTYTIKAKYPGDIFHKTSTGTVKGVVSP
jgi:trimeric autotransporter adhesin